MIRSRHPLQEKLTLFWHDHFATTDQDTPMMLAQNRTLRRHALGRFPDLLQAVTRDPAMLLFLSLANSDKEAPNENYARELMELFTLGRGYSERDIRQAARALTGFRADWHDDGTVRTSYDREWHDGGPKRVLGKVGRFDWQRRAPPVRPPPRPRAVHGRQAVGLLRRRSRCAARRAPTSCASTAAPATASARSSARSSSQPGALPAPRRAQHGQVARSSTWPARCAAPARESTATTGPGCSRRWASTRSGRPRWRAGSGARAGSRRTRCACASTSPTTCSTPAASG